MKDNKKGLNKIPKEVKNGMNDIRNVEKVTVKEKLKLRCKCQHTDESGKTVLFRSGSETSPVTGNHLFVCKICGAYLDIGEITDEELERAIDTICRAADVIKMRLRTSQSEEDHESFKTVWRIQYMLKSGKFKDLFTAARRRNKNNNRRGGNSDGFSIGAPRSRR